MVGHLCLSLVRPSWSVLVVVPSKPLRPQAQSNRVQLQVKRYVAGLEQRPVRMQQVLSLKASILAAIASDTAVSGNIGAGAGAGRSWPWL